jgi:hypothetical protein
MSVSRCSWYYRELKIFIICFFSILFFFSAVWAYTSLIIESSDPGLYFVIPFEVEIFLLKNYLLGIPVLSLSLYFITIPFRSILLFIIQKFKGIKIWKKIAGLGLLVLCINTFLWISAIDQLPKIAQKVGSSGGRYDYRTGVSYEQYKAEKEKVNQKFLMYLLLSLFGTSVGVAVTFKK